MFDPTPEYVTPRYLAISKVDHMAGWHDLPLELKEDILGRCLPELGDGRIRDYIRISPFPASLRPVIKIIKDLKQEYNQALSNLLTISKSWTEMLMPGLKKDLDLMKKYIEDLEVEIETMPGDPDMDMSNWISASYSGPRSRSSCLEYWKDCYILDRQELDQRLYDRYREP